MHKSYPIFRAFSLRGLLVAGTIASLSLPLGWEARGIGGSAIQPTYTPRESVSANPSINLIFTDSAATASVSSSESASPGDGSATRHVSSDNEGRGTTRKHRRRKASEEEGGTRVVNSPGTGGATGTESKDYKEGKEVKNAIIAPSSKPLLTLSTGFESRYIYHGVDIVGFNSSIPTTDIPHGKTPADLATIADFKRIASQQPRANDTSPIVYVNASLEFKGLQFAVSYLNATDHTIPTRVEVANQAVTFNRYYDTLQSPYLVSHPNLAGGPNRQFLYPTGQYNDTSKLYKEIDINLDYTVGIIANVLDATVGYNSYIIPDHDFKGTNYQGEAFGRLTYKQIPYIRPNITYFRYISDARGYEFVQENQNNSKGLDPAQGRGFFTREIGEYLNGNYVEARLDSEIPLFKLGEGSVKFSPYALVSVNDGYLTKEIASHDQYTEFNTFETGFKIPVPIGDHFSVTPYLNYGYDISEHHEANTFRGTLPPFKEDVWGGVTLSYRF